MIYDDVWWYMEYYAEMAVMGHCWRVTAVTFSPPLVSLQLVWRRARRAASWHMRPAMTRYSATRHFSIRFDKYHFSSFLIISHHVSSCSHHFSSFSHRYFAEKKNHPNPQSISMSLSSSVRKGAAASKLPRNFFSELHWLQLLRITESNPHHRILWELHVHI